MRQILINLFQPKIFMIHSAALIINLAMFFCHFHQLQYSLPQLLTFNPKMTTFFVRSVAPICANCPNIWTSTKSSPSTPHIRHLLRRSPRNKARPTLLTIFHPKVSPRRTNLTLPEPRRAENRGKTTARKRSGSESVTSNAFHVDPRPPPRRLASLRPRSWRTDLTDRCTQLRFTVFCNYCL